VDNESNFGELVVKSLRKLGFETWQEVSFHGSSIDIVGKINNIYCIFELKMTLNDGVLEQVHRTIHYGDYSCIIIPWRKKYHINKVKSLFLNYYGIGLIEIKNEAKTLECFREPSEWGMALNLFEGKDTIKFINWNFAIVKQPKKKDKSVSIEEFLFDDQKDCVAGSTSGTVMTPFKRSCNLIYEYLQENPGASKKEVWNTLNGFLHWSSYASMCASFRNYSHVDEIKRIKWK